MSAADEVVCCPFCLSLDPDKVGVEQATGKVCRDPFHCPIPDSHSANGGPFRYCQYCDWREELSKEPPAGAAVNWAESDPPTIRADIRRVGTAVGRGADRRAGRASRRLLRVTRGAAVTDPRSTDEMIASGQHEAAEDRRIGARMRQPENRARLEQRALVTEQLCEALSAARTQLADEKAAHETSLAKLAVKFSATPWLARNVELESEVKACRAREAAIRTELESFRNGNCGPHAFVSSLLAVLGDETGTDKAEPPADLLHAHDLTELTEEHDIWVWQCRCIMWGYAANKPAAEHDWKRHVAAVGAQDQGSTE